MNPAPPTNGQPAAPALSLPNIDTTAITNGLNTGLSGIKDSVNAAVTDFSNKDLVGASNEFMESNTIVAKFAFIVVVLIGFMFLFKLGMMLITYFLMPSSSPMLVDGMISGNEAVTIKQDPRSNNSLIQLSENRDSGAEFTYSVWLYLKGESDTNSHHVFTKGNDKSRGAPTLTLKKDSSGSMIATVTMDTMKSEGIETNSVTAADGKVTEPATNSLVTQDIKNLPLKKWVHIAIRLQNRIMDIYVNGVLTARKDLAYTPRQNYGDVLVCQDGGFSGNLSNLQYFSSALNVFQLNQLVASGPNTSTSKSTGSADANKGFYQYMSQQFYTSNL